jgi:tetratricopeptide (TPR) repeat protein
MQDRREELANISSKYLSADEQNPSLILRAASILSESESVPLKKEAVRLFEHAITLLPSSTSARFGLASTLYQIGNVERAEKVYRELLAQNPNDAGVLNDLAWILQERHRRYDEALKLADRGLSIVPDEVHLLDTRGVILSKMDGRLTDARADFERLVALSPPDTAPMAKALLQLGRVCARLNAFDQAKKHLEKALDIDNEIDVFTPEERAEITSLVQQSGI